MADLDELRSSGASSVAALAALAVSCASLQSTPRIIPFPTEATGNSHRPGLITSYRQALDAVLSVMDVRLGIPPFAGTLDLYPDRDGMAAALEREGFQAADARLIADHLDGIAQPGRVLANDAVLRWEHWPARIAFLAHELTHVAEYALAAARPSSADQWLREGFAEWVSWRVVDELGLSSYGMRRHVALVHLREVCDRHALPPFSQLAAQRGWVKGPELRAADPGYDQAFLAAELLVQLHGVEAALAYVRLHAASGDSPANFRAAFGEDAIHFEAAFQAQLHGALR